MSEDLRARLESALPTKGMCVTCKKLPAVKPARRCSWCLEAAQSSDERAHMALERRKAWDGVRVRADGSCAGCGAAGVPEWYLSGSRCKSCTILDRRTATYGLTIDQQDKLYEMSGNTCMVCGKSQKGRALSIDHRHSDNTVRGVLCGKGGYSDNEIIGFLFDDAAHFAAIAAYLVDPPARRIGIGAFPWTTEEVIAEITRMVVEYRKRLGYNDC